MKNLFISIGLLASSFAFAQSINGNLLRLAPSTLPALCRLGDVRVNTSNSNLEMCNGSNTWSSFSTSGATVNSVGLSDGSTKPIFTITGSPVTSTGTLTETLSTQSAAFFFAGPTSGGNVQPAFRAVVSTDIPTLNQNTTGTAVNITASTNSTLTSLSNLSTLGTVTTGSWNATPVPSQYGGTGANLSASTGVLHISSGTVSASSVVIGGGTSDITGTLPATSGGTGNTAYAVGDVLISSVTNQLAPLHASAGSTTFVLTNNGAGVAPSWQAAPGASGYVSSSAVVNAGLSCAVTSNSISFLLKQADGATDPASGTGAVSAYFRSTNAASSTIPWASASVTSAMSVTVPGTAATLGQVSGFPAYVWVYLLNDAGTLDMCVIGGDPLDDTELQASTQISSGATSNSVLYCKNSHSGNKPVRLFGRCLETETTAGTWASNCTSLDLLPVPKFNTTAWSAGTTTTMSATATIPTKPTVMQLDVIKSRRVGKMMNIKVYMIANSTTGAAAGSGIYEWLIPGAGVADTSVTSASASTSLIGTSANEMNAILKGSGWFVGVGRGLLVPELYDSTHFVFQTSNSSGTDKIDSAGDTAFNASSSWGLGADIEIPILGWTDYGP